MRAPDVDVEILAGPEPGTPPDRRAMNASAQPFWVFPCTAIPEKPPYKQRRARCAMDCGSLFPGMINTVGGLLPALISLGLVAARLTHSRLGKGVQLRLCVFAIALSVVFARVDVTADAISLHFPPGAAAVLCYLVWRGYHIPPCMAFAFTYASMLPVDVALAKLATGPHFNPEGIGGAGWLDGLLIFPALTALAIVYANWRMAKVGRAGLIWFGQQTEGPRLSRRLAIWTKPLLQAPHPPDIGKQ